MADTDQIRALVFQEQQRATLSWQLAGRPRVSSRWYAIGVPPVWVGRLRPDEQPPPEAYEIPATGTRGVIEALAARARLRRTAPTGAVSPLAVPSPVAAGAVAVGVARERVSAPERAARRARRARAPRAPRAARPPRPPRRPRRPRPPRAARAPRPPRAARVKGQPKTHQGWCYGLAQGFTLYPPPPYRSYPIAFDPNSVAGAAGLWTKADSQAACVSSICRGPVGRQFQHFMRTIFGKQPTEPPPPPPRRVQRRRQRALPPAPVPIAAAPPPPIPGPDCEVIYNPYVSTECITLPDGRRVQYLAGVDPALLGR